MRSISAPYILEREKKKGGGVRNSNLSQDLDRPGRSPELEWQVSVKGTGQYVIGYECTL